MDNFIFSESLEISILEHRLLQLFEMLNEIDIDYFFPSVLFNESFWQTPNQKRILILTHNQLEWFGQHPIQRSHFYKDLFLLDLLKTLKLHYFSYTKIDLKGLIDVFKSKSKFSISDFHSFGDEKNSPIIKLNEITENIVEDTEKIFQEKKIRPTLGKVSAVKFYTKFYNHKTTSSLILTEDSNTDYWENFFQSLTLIDEKQNTSLIKNAKFYFTTSKGENLTKLEEEFNKQKTLKNLIEGNVIEFETLDITDFELKNSFDYIFIASILSKTPTNIITKYDNDYYETIGRLIFKDRSDEKKALEKAFELKSEFKKIGKLDTETLNSIDFEIIFQEFKNQNIIKLIEDNFNFLERTYVRFSVITLSFLIKAIKGLNKKGYLEVWDSNENKNSRYSLALQTTKKNRIYTLVDFDLYSQILDSFGDIKINHRVRQINEILSEEIFDGKDSFITLQNLLQLIADNKEVSKKFFDIDNFIHKDEVKKIALSLKNYESLKHKNIRLLGIPSIIYSNGFKKFKKLILEKDFLKKYINEEFFRNNNFNSYINEFVFALIPAFYMDGEDNGQILIAREDNSTHNKEFYKFLHKNGLDKDKIMPVIFENWDKIIESPTNNDDIELLEITNLQ